MLMMIVSLLAPSNNAVVSLPTTFRWVPRSEFPSDNYELVLSSPPEYLYYSPSSCDSYVLNSAYGIAFNIYYEWFIQINSPWKNKEIKLPGRVVAIGQPCSFLKAPNFRL